MVGSQRRGAMGICGHAAAAVAAHRSDTGSPDDCRTDPDYSAYTGERSGQGLGLKVKVHDPAALPRWYNKLMAKTKPATVTDYINVAPKEAQPKLREIRAILKAVAPKAKEAMKWGSPVLEEKRILFAYTAYKSHLNFMPTHPSMAPFKKELAEYKTGKDTIQFSYDKPLPKALIRKIAAFRAKDVRENDARWMY